MRSRGVWGLLSTNLAYGWGPQGHRVVGTIAESHLALETKKIIAEEFNINNLADIAIWADKVWRNRKHKNTKTRKHLELHQCKRRRMDLCDFTGLPEEKLCY